MRRYSEAIKTDVRRQMSLAHRQSVTQISGAGHSRGHPLQPEEDLALAGRGGAGIEEGS
jgi:hypothetical protein